MVRKIIFTSLVLSGLVFFAMTGESAIDGDAAAEFEQARSYYESRDYQKAEQGYQNIVNRYAGTDYAFQAQKGLVIVYIAWDKQTQAQAAYQELLANFHENEHIAQAVFEVGDTYYWLGKYKSANQLYQCVLDNWPDAKHAMWSQMGLAISNIADGNDAPAEVATERLISNFSNDPNLAEALSYIAGRYEWSRKFVQAESLYSTIAQQFPESPQAIKAQLAAPKMHIFSLIDAQELANALADVDTLIAEFPGHPDLPSVLYEIGARYDWLKEFRPTEFADAVYQRIVDRFPDSPQARTAGLKVSRIDVLAVAQSADPSATLAAINSLIADFNDQSNLPWVVSREIAEQLYIRAFQLHQQGLIDQARDCFQKAAMIWEVVINELADPAETPQACCWAGDCYRKLGQYEKSIEYYQKVVNDYPGFRVAWDALFQVGRNYESLKKSGLISPSEADSNIKAAYQQLVENYPDCKAAGIARSLSE